MHFEEVMGGRGGEKADQKTKKEGKQEKGDNSIRKAYIYWNGEWV